jgi:tetratricopeptide (TPR) repeat protein
LRQRHSERFLAIADQARTGIYGPRSLETLSSLDVARDNLYASLNWLIRTPTDPEAAERALRLVSALCGYWSARGFFAESRQWIEQVLPLSSAKSSTRAHVLLVSANAAIRQDDWEAAEVLIEESMSIYKNLNDRTGIAQAVNALGRLNDVKGDYTTARNLHKQGLELAREIDDPHVIAASLLNLGLASHALRDFSAARKYHEECLEVCQKMGELAGIGWSLDNLGDTTLATGDIDAACDLYCRSLRVFREQRSRHGIAACLMGLGWVETAWGLDRPGAAVRVARLFSAAHSLFKDMEVMLRPVERADYERDLAAVKQFLGESAFNNAWTSGHAMTIEEAISYGLEIRTPKTESATDIRYVARPVRKASTQRDSSLADKSIRPAPVKLRAHPKRRKDVL